MNSTALVFWTGGPQSRQKGTSSLGDPSLGSVREVFRLLKSQHHEMMSSLLFSPKCNSDNNRWKQFRQSRLFQRMPKKRVFYFQSKIAAEVPAKSHICSANVRSILFSDSLKKGAYSEARKIYMEEEARNLGRLLLLWRRVYFHYRQRVALQFLASAHQVFLRTLEKLKGSLLLQTVKKARISRLLTERHVPVTKKTLPRVARYSPLSQNLLVSPPTMSPYLFAVSLPPPSLPAVRSSLLFSSLFHLPPYSLSLSPSLSTLPRVWVRWRDERRSREREKKTFVTLLLAPPLLPSIFYLDGMPHISRTTPAATISLILFPSKSGLIASTGLCALLWLVG